MSDAALPIAPAVPVAAPSDAAFGALRSAAGKRFRKVLITGLGRSGTTALAMLLQQWGFYVGTRKTWGVLENAELRQRMLAGDLDGVMAELDAWQAEHERIAWKEPKLFAGVGAQLIARLPADWLVIAVFRDPVPVALRRAKSDGVQFIQALERTASVQTRLAEFVAATDKATILVSYERLMTMPEVVLEEITSRLDTGDTALPTLDEVWNRLLEHRKGYRNIDQKRLLGKAPAARPAEGGAAASRLATFDAASLRHLNAMLPWSTAVGMAPELVLGTGVAEPARPLTADGLEAEAAALDRVLPLAGASVLVMRCFEGLRAIALAPFCREVWAVDAHVEWVVKAQLRVWLAGLERRVSVHLFDPERPPFEPQLAALGHEGLFDVVVHADALHRLADPVAELQVCAKVAHRLVLRTWLPPDEMANATLSHALGDFAVFESRPPRVGFVDLVEPPSPARALTSSALETAILAVGFDSIGIVSMQPEAGGQLVELVALRHSA